MSGFGFGISPDELLRRAQNALQQAQIPNTWYENLSCNPRGTVAFLSFHEAGHLRLANAKIRRAQISHAAGSSVWLDARRTKSENRPNRAIHRAAEGLGDLNASLEKNNQRPPWASQGLHKNMKRMAIQNGMQGEVLCFWNPKRSELEFTPACRQGYAALSRESDLDQIAAWSSLE